MEPLVSRTPERVTKTFHSVLTALLFLAMSVPVTAHAAAASGAEKEVPRSTGFGGACPKCELSGRRLAGAHFMGADFSGSAFVGSDLREAHFLGSNFTGANLSHADL